MLKMLVNWNANWDNHFGKQFGEFLKIKLDILILYNVAIVLLGIYSKELKTYVHTKTHNWMFICFIHNCPKLEGNQDVLQEVKAWINCGTSKQWKIIQWLKKKKDMNSQAMNIQGRTLNAYRYVKEANLKRLHTIYSQL